jgi:hypothetical protein
MALFFPVAIKFDFHELYKEFKDFAIAHIPTEEKCTIYQRSVK